MRDQSEFHQSDLPFLCHCLARLPIWAGPGDRRRGVHFNSCQLVGALTPSEHFLSSISSSANVSYPPQCISWFSAWLWPGYAYPRFISGEMSHGDNITAIKMAPCGRDGLHPENWE